MNSYERIFAKLNFSRRKKTRLVRQLQRLINAGVTVRISLSTLYDQYSKGGTKPKEPMALMIAEWNQKIQLGKPLSTAMSGWVSPAEQMIIEAGEQNDNLANSLSDALEANDASSKIFKTIASGVLYPIILMIVQIGMYYGFSTEVVPTLSEVVPPETWTGNPHIMYVISQFIVSWLPLLIILLVGTIIAIVFSLSHLTGPTRPYLDKMPPYSIYKVTQGASFMISLRGFLSAGMAIPEALRRMKKVSNPYSTERIEAILARVNMGRNLGQAMLDAGNNFPDDEIATEIAVYSGLDEFDKNLDTLAKEWINDAVERAKQASKTLNTVLIISIAGSVGFLVITLFEFQEMVTTMSQQIM